MNIKSRLEKLEKSSHLDSEFCACRGEITTSVVLPDLDRTEEEYERLIAEAQTPGNCDQCGKVIERRLIIVEGVKPEESDDVLT